MNPFSLTLPEAPSAALLEHAQAELPNECCGFFAGRLREETGLVFAYLPLVNQRASPIEFATEPRSVLQAFKIMREEQWELLAVCHSHPTSAPIPSRQDLVENTYGPTIPWVIVGLADSQPIVRAWRLLGDRYESCELLRVLE